MWFDSTTTAATTNGLVEARLYKTPGQKIKEWQTNVRLSLEESVSSPERDIIVEQTRRVIPEIL